MKKMIATSIVVVAATLAHAASFDASTKALLRDVATQAKQRMETATALEGKTVTLLPVHGDADGYMERLLIGAIVDAGKTGVISNDAKRDERFKRILADIRWDEAQRRLSTVDTATIDELGRLKSTQILMEARLEISKAEKDAVAGGPAFTTAELNLLAYAVSTKQYVWSTNIVISDEPPPPPPPEELPEPVVTAATVPLHVEVSSSAAQSAGRVSSLLDTSIRGMLAQLGYVLDGKRSPDVTVSLETSRETFDKTAGWLVFDGSLKIKVNVCGAEARLLSETSISGRGARGLGETQADRNLADNLGEQAAGWIKRILKHDAIGFEAQVFSVRTTDAAVAEKIRATAAAMDGARGVTTESVHAAKGFTTFRAVYEKAKFPGGFTNALFAAHPDIVK